MRGGQRGGRGEGEAPPALRVMAKIRVGVARAYVPAVGVPAGVFCDGGRNPRTTTPPALPSSRETKVAVPKYSRQVPSMPTI